MAFLRYGKERGLLRQEKPCAAERGNPDRFRPRGRSDPRLVRRGDRTFRRGKTLLQPPDGRCDPSPRHATGERSRLPLLHLVLRHRALPPRRRGDIRSDSSKGGNPFHRLLDGTARNGLGKMGNFPQPVPGHPEGHLYGCKDSFRRSESLAQNGIRSQTGNRAIRETLSPMQTDPALP